MLGRGMQASEKGALFVGLGMGCEILRRDSPCVLFCLTDSSLKASLPQREVVPGNSSGKLKSQATDVFDNLD